MPVVESVLVGYTLYRVTLYIHFIYTLYTLYIHSIYTLYTLYRVTLYIHSKAFSPISAVVSIAYACACVRIYIYTYTVALTFETFSLRMWELDNEDLEIHNFLKNTRC